MIQIANRCAESLRPAISLVKTRFSGTLRYKDGDHLYIDLSPQSVRYFGIPTREVDDAWAGLIGSEHIKLSVMQNVALKRMCQIMRELSQATSLGTSVVLIEMHSGLTRDT